MNTYEVVAHNTAPDSSNRIHSDDVARQYGFRGGLVLGVDVWAYLTRPCVDRWGIDFLTGGTMTARFLSPVYEGETVTATLADDGTLTASVADSVRAVGSAALATPPAFPELPVAPLSDRPPASSAALAPGTPLGTLAFHFRAEPADAYLDDIREHHPLYRSEGVAHPGWLARQCNTILATHVALGPWIHVGTTAHHLGLAHPDDPLEIRAVVTDEYDRKGHRLVDLDVTIATSDHPVYLAHHTAIWQPRPALA